MRGEGFDKQTPTTRLLPLLSDGGVEETTGAQIFMSLPIHGVLLHMMYRSVFLALFPLVQGLSQVSVVNRCKFSVFLASVQRDVSPIMQLGPGKTYQETYRPVVNGTGVSIKIASNSRIGEETDGGRSSAIFNVSPITQLEYSYVPEGVPDLFYDISAINDVHRRQFCQYGYELHTTSSSCDSVVCPPRCDAFCPSVYNLPDDNWATRGCKSNFGLELVLCSSNSGVA
ncbi:hypothetical protein VFPPC_17465 [Pochonia chlamydosporia 170]|uniref:Uncharacterized protein n=1 Tax=Pochonia chlamydosporia 170 TaxID=1380566 RepID=A0A219ARW2_METCM|nr:hypothetical protein VFPPC_18339 [Pochonia chlamydosporia 170]XP_022285802.1 hypothetical protein VFPPC_17465 [Pochonia chlamydosporia 170]OWT42537.1 hypothetical protein VFPPC_18339 [Pochonia chlamydosporia 170]OWT43372.1 hypothetical protein VFPPC_17465 [Pochonia chlamydosporia 170]